MIEITQAASAGPGNGTAIGKLEEEAFIQGYLEVGTFFSRGRCRGNAKLLDLLTPVSKALGDTEIENSL